MKVVQTIDLQMDDMRAIHIHICKYIYYTIHENQQ